MKLYHMPWRLVQNKVRGMGGREIDKFRGKSQPEDTANGSEAWIGSVTCAFNASAGNYNLGLSEVILPDGREMYLTDAIALDLEKVLGREHIRHHGSGLGMLIKYLDAMRQYTLQAHPTREWAKTMWNSEIGKEESWYVIGLRNDMEESPHIFLGFKEGVTREKFEEGYRKNDLNSLENLCHKIPVHVGDVFYVGGGVPHALGTGCFVIEVQEPSDLTVVPLPQSVLLHRLFPNAREDSELPIEDDTAYETKMLGAFLYEGCNYEENIKRWKSTSTTLREGEYGREVLLLGPDKTKCFSFSRLDVNGSMPLRQTGFIQIAIVLRGEGRIAFKGGGLAVRQADELFLPCDIPDATIEGNISVILCHPGGVSY